MLLSPISYMSMTAITAAVVFLAIPTFAQDSKEMLQPDCVAMESCQKLVD